MKGESAVNHRYGAASAEVVFDSGRTIVHLHGELDMATVPMVESVLRAISSSRPDAVLLDAGKVQFMDSAGLRAILETRARVAAGGGTLHVRNPPPNVRRLFAAAGETL
jgi:anti-anti-sigma factor